jgi:transcriptional accessory protein Tex/SPT6
MQQKIIDQISNRTGLPSWKIKNTVDLLSDGATIPFISRYRKEAIGSLDEVAVSSINKELKQLQELIARKDTVLSTIDEQGKLTAELRQKIGQCWDPTQTNTSKYFLGNYDPYTIKYALFHHPMHMADNYPKAAFRIIRNKSIKE